MWWEIYKRVDLISTCVLGQPRFLRVRISSTVLVNFGLTYYAPRITSTHLSWPTTHCVLGQPKSVINILAHKNKYLFVEVKTKFGRAKSISHCIEFLTTLMSCLANPRSPRSGPGFCKKKIWISMRQHNSWYLGWPTTHRSLGQPIWVDLLRSA